MADVVEGRLSRCCYARVTVGESGAVEDDGGAFVCVLCRRECETVALAHDAKPSEQS